MTHDPVPDDQDVLPKCPKCGEPATYQNPITKEYWDANAHWWRLTEPVPADQEKRCVTCGEEKDFIDHDETHADCRGTLGCTVNYHPFVPADAQEQEKQAMETRPMVYNDEMMLPLNGYEAVNLLEACVAVMQASGPLSALNTGDWIGQIRWKLSDIIFGVKPNKTFEEMIAVASSRAALPSATPEPMPSGYRCKSCGLWVSPVCFNCGNDPREQETSNGK